jgi:hypothetical protein
LRADPLAKFRIKAAPATTVAEPCAIRKAPSSHCAAAGNPASPTCSELITDPAKLWKAVRLSSVGTAVAFEVLYTVREQQRRKEQQAKLAECRSRE